MSLSKYISTRETTNLARVAKIILGPCADVLRAVLAKEITPQALSHNVKTFITNHPKNKKSPINKQQEQLVYGGNYSQFDITLLYLLLRNMCLIPQHTKQWGNEPDSGDRSVSANIERIRLMRNEYGHSSDTSISDTNFNVKWQNMFDVVQELEIYLGSSTVYQDAVKEIKTCSMDPEQSNKYIKEFFDLNRKMQIISGEVESMKKSIIPGNVKEQYAREISTWVEDDDVFLESHNFQAILEQVKLQSYITFVGVPGSGKTATARHIALILQREGHEILPIIDKNKIQDYCDPYNPQVILIDDILGVFGLNVAELHILTKYQSCFVQPTMPETKILMTCREAIFRNEALSNTFLSRKSNIIQLHSEANALSLEDKYKFLDKYNLETNLFTPNNLSLTSKMFPFLCKVYSEKSTFKDYGPDFFISPIPCILTLLEEMKKRNRIQYASLVLLMANQNKLSENLDTEYNDEKFNDIKSSVLKRCKVRESTDNFEITDALTEMEGTYTRKWRHQFEFVHDSMYEITAYHFGCQYPELILQYMSSDYIAHNITIISENKTRKLEKIEERHYGQSEENVIDLRLILKDSHYPLLAKRLFKDIENGELYNVFRNEALNHPTVIQSFIGQMTQRSYSELYSVFFTEMTDKFKISRDEKEKYGVNQDEYFQILSLLFDERNIFNDPGIWSSVKAISWVVYCGHHQILKYLIDKIINETGNAYALFQSANKIGRNRGFKIRNNNTDIHNGAEDIDKSDKSKSDKHNTSNSQPVSTLPCRKFCFLSCGFNLKTYFNASTEMDFELDELNNTFNEIESLTAEQWRLLCLGCFSCDLNTVKIILNNLSNDAINNTVTNEEKIFKDIKPLVVACSFGCSNIVKELLKAGADVNLKAVFETPLTAACQKGYLMVVEELIKAKADVNLEDGNQTPLTTACKEGHLCIVKALIKAGADVNQTDALYTPLAAACSNGHICIVKTLLKWGADANQKYRNESILITQCQRGDIEIVKELIRAGADVNLRDKYQTPLTVACKEGHLNILKEFINAGADVNLRDGYQTPLTVACKEGHLNIVKELIKAGADVNKKAFVDTPLTAAYRNGHFSIIEELLNVGANANVSCRGKTVLTAECQRGNLKIVRELIKAGAIVNVIDIRQTPLTAACEEGHLDIVEQLILARADVNQKTYNGTPLTAAYKNGHLSVAKKLIKAGANINCRYRNETLLTAACKRGDLAIVQELISAGADVNHKNGYRTPLVGACEKGHLCIVKELVKAGAYVNMKVPYLSPLMIAYNYGYLGIVKELIKAGSDVNFKCGISTLLTTASRDGDLCTVRLLIEAGAQVNPVGDYQSPLEGACRQGHLNIVEELVKARANLNLKTGNATILTIACQKGHLSIVEVLIKAGADVDLEDGCEAPLTAACKEGHLSIVSMLLKAGANINLEASVYSPLTIAYNCGHLRIFTELIRQGIDVNLKFKNKTFLTSACYDGHLTVVEELIELGANINLQDNYQTPLTTACRQGHKRIVEELIKRGANINLEDEYQTPLTIACRKGHLGIVKCLIIAGADINKRDRCTIATGNETGFLSLDDEIKNHNLYAYIDQYQTPLTAACDNGYLSIVKELIKERAEINLKDKYHTPLILACLKGHLNIVEELIRAGADVNLEIRHHTPLTLACRLGYFSNFQELNKSVACVNLFLQREGDFTSIAESSSSGAYVNVECSLSIVKALIKAGACVNTKTFSGTPLSHACKNENLIIAEELIKAGADVNLVDKHQLLTLACGKGCLTIVKLLIKSGTDVNLRNKIKSPKQEEYLSGNEQIIKEGQQSNWDLAESFKREDDNVVDHKNDCIRPLTAACREGHLRIVKELIIAGADVNFKDGWHTPLTTACQGGHLQIVEELKKAKADVNLGDNLNTPFTTAFENGHLCIAETLRKAGAEVILKHKCPKLLTLACQKGYIFFVEELIKLGTDVNDDNSSENHYSEISEYIYIEMCLPFENVIEINCVDRIENVEKLESVHDDVQKTTFIKPLTAACQNGQLEIVKMLIKAGACVNFQDGYNTPLTTASQDGDLNIVKELIKSGADVNFGDEYYTPLTAACHKGHLIIVEELMEAGADVNLRDKYYTPLTAVCHDGHLGIVKELIKAGANVNLRDKYSTPLTTACHKGHFIIVKELIEAGADVNLRDRKNTPLTAACLKMHKSVVIELINAGADVNLQDGDFTPLTIIEESVKSGTNVNSKDTFYSLFNAACDNGLFSIADILLNAGAKVNREESCSNLLTCACFYGHFVLVKELIKAGADVNQESSFEQDELVCENQLTNEVISEDIEKDWDFNNAYLEIDTENQNKIKYRKPLLAACQGGHLNIVQELIKTGAGANLEDSKWILHAMHNCL